MELIGEAFGWVLPYILWYTIVALCVRWAGGK